MSGTTVEEREKQRQYDETQRELDRGLQSQERRRDRTLTFLAAVVTGAFTLTGTLGSQIVSKMNADMPLASKATTKASNFLFETVATQISPRMAATILRHDSETGETWIARYRGDTPDFEWVRIEGPQSAAQAQPTSSAYCA